MECSENGDPTRCYALLDSQTPEDKYHVSHIYKTSEEPNMRRGAERLCKFVNVLDGAFYCVYFIMD